MNASFRVEDGLQQLGTKAAAFAMLPELVANYTCTNSAERLNKGNDKGSGRTKDRLDMTMYRP